MLIRDVVTQNEQAEFANDVQLSWYPNDSRNLPLVRGYMFTGKAIENKVPSVQVLKTIRDSFLWQTGTSPNNRLVVIATYGHGKSHLALSLANFFGKPADTPELDAILRNIAHVTSAGEAQGLRDYKENRTPHLVVRIRGDQPASLPEQFIAALETAIEEHPNTRGTSLPFWFEEALRLFSILTPDQVERAEAFLQEHNEDLASLIARIQRRDATSYELCLKSATAALHVRPNLGGEVSLAKILEWAANEFCTGDNPKASGILILFDEFSLFIQKYANRLNRAEAPLQDLLNGVENAKKKAVFVAFSQHDPNTVAREIFRSGGDKLDSLLKELERLPAPYLNLHTSLEMVLNAYLKQSDTFDELREQCASSFVHASSATRSMMRRIYNEEKGWDSELFDKTITYGCFPLHPLTASLFSSVEFQQVGTHRSMIGFVLDTLEKRLDADAIVGSKPNWIHPVELVDWFQEMLNEERYREYCYAYDSAFLGVSPDAVQEAVLKGMLLFVVGRLELGKIGANYEQAMSHLTGYKPEDCTAALETLKNGGYIRYDENKKVYAFWAANSGATKIESMLEAELKNRTFSIKEWQLLNKDKKDGTGWTDPQEISGITWGSPEDWKAKEVLLTRALFTVDNLKKFLPLSGFAPKQPNLILNRGCIVRLIALSEEDTAFYHANAAEFLKEALGNTATPPPILLTIPSEPTPHFCTNFMRYDQLNSWDNEKRKDVTIEAYTQRVQDLKKIVGDPLTRLRESSSVVVPQAYFNYVQLKGAEHSPNLAMQVLYAHAYSHSARPYFTHYSFGATNHRKAVELLCKSLARDTIQADYPVLITNKIAKDLLNMFLKTQGSSGWGVVDFNNHVQVPTTQRIKIVWDWMDKSFVAGSQSVPVKKVLTKLLNPPFGYDPHQIALLFSAWYGLNRRNIRLIKSNNGKAEPTDLHTYLEQAKSPTNLIEILCAIDPPMLARTDPDALENELRATIQRVKDETFTLADATVLYKQLISLAQNPALDADLIAQGQQSAKRLQEDLEAAREYKKQEDDIIHKLSDETLLTVPKTIQLLAQVKNMPSTGRINETAWKTTTSLCQDTLRKMANCVEKECRKLEKFVSLADYGSNKTKLESLKGQIIPIGELSLNERITTAFSNLEKLRDEFSRQEKDRDLVATINAMQENAPLQTLEANLSLLKVMAPHSQTTQESIDKKYQALQRSLDSGRKLLDDKVKMRSKVENLAQAETLYEELLKCSGQFAGSSMEPLHSATVEECRTLVTFFTGLKQIADIVPQSPSDIDDLRERRNHILTEAGVLLTDTQRQQAQIAFSLMEAKIAQKQQSSLDWLSGCEKQIQRGEELDEMENRLSRIPPFFPDSAKERLAQAHHNLKQRLNTDEAEREAQRQDAPVLGQLQSLPVAGSLNQLRATLQQLEALAPNLPKTQELKVTLRAQIQKAIDQHLATLAHLETQATKPLDLSQIKTLEQSIQRAFSQFEESDESQRLNELLVTVQRLRTEKEEQESSRAHDALIAKAVQQMNPKGSLASLRSHQTQLTAYTPKLNATQASMDAKRVELASAIETALSQLVAWEERIAQTTTIQELREIEKQGFAMQSRYAETPESQRLQDTLSQCAALRSILEEKERIEREKPASYEDYNQLTSRLTGIQQEHAPLLTESQSKAFHKAQETLDAYVSQKATEAEEWLRQRERELEAESDTYALRTTLDSPPPFLPTACLPTLGSLRVNNHKRIDNDVVGKIVDSFKSISDPAIQKICLDRLQQALPE